MGFDVDNSANNLIEQQTRDTMAENQRKLQSITKQELQIVKSQANPDWGTASKTNIGKEPNNG